MCGITGIWQTGAKTKEQMLATAQKMTDTLTHRGPDDAGVWIDSEAALALGHRRLSIVDLSSAGHQPMLSVCGRYVISFNGEIYNHLALRTELNYRFRGHSDTETFIACIATWGLEEALKRCVGMFALALWDRQRRELTLVRDRFGEKPLYYGWVGKGVDQAFLFGSELKALRAYPGFSNPVSRYALEQYLRFMYVPAPLSIYEGIYKLEPGCLLTMTESSVGFVKRDDQEINEVSDKVFTIKHWWSLKDSVAVSRESPITVESEAINELESCLNNAVRIQSSADVPISTFLSGGIDSSLIAALMQQQASEQGIAPVKTFTIGFDDKTFDETPHAHLVARHLGTNHHEIRVNAKMAADVIPNLPWMYDEPFADSSQIPTHLLCRAVSEHVKVALSGDGGDELFGGYNRYLWGVRIWNHMSWLPYPMRQVLGRTIKSVSVNSWEALGGFTGFPQLGDKVHKLTALLNSARNIDDLYLCLISEWSDPGSVVRWNVEKTKSLYSVPSDDDLTTSLMPNERMMVLDSLNYLPDDILCKVDRAAMACSLETRMPFLDHRVVELAWRLPMNMKIRGNQGKWVLRQILYKHVPHELIERPKAGFAIPIGQWLQGPLRDWAESLLSEQRLNEEGYLHAAPIRKAWVEHLSGKRDWTGRIWAVLMFQAWLEREKG